MGTVWTHTLSPGAGGAVAYRGFERGQAEVMVSGCYPVTAESEWRDVPKNLECPLLPRIATGNIQVCSPYVASDRNISTLFRYSAQAMDVWNKLKAPLVIVVLE